MRLLNSLEMVTEWIEGIEIRDVSLSLSHYVYIYMYT